ncbi:hypothetical protein GCM10007855_30120 [Aliivibrio sifiae]|uniref:Uncharacterized protein n=1 Tax=Aliivibrio sifiae TaxID=566293 RepID=A0ABQ6AL26_9GAMM|nr:hypothetical protein GCM10007855_30120 [Aliivibrio sifiae]
MVLGAVSNKLFPIGAQPISNNEVHSDKILSMINPSNNIPDPFIDLDGDFFTLNPAFVTFIPYFCF